MPATYQVSDQIGSYTKVHVHKTMTVRELIDVLSRQSQDAPIVMTREGGHYGAFTADSLSSAGPCVVVNFEHGGWFSPREYSGRTAEVAA